MNFEDFGEFCGISVNFVIFFVNFVNFVFRQSLSIAELDRMFEDDSTQSFEDLERRLKTPGKSTTKPKIVKPDTIW